MSTVGLVYYNVLDTNSGGYISSGVNIFSEILSLVKVSKISKLGILAEPGTKIVLNKIKEIMVGRTGIYELNDNTVTNMYFVQPKSYVRDTDAEAEYLSKGMTAINKAELDRANAIDALNKKYNKDTGTEDEKTAYWDEYKNIQTKYETAYKAALIEYNMGRLGVYITSSESQDLYNVIIDYIAEE